MSSPSKLVWNEPELESNLNCVWAAAPITIRSESPSHAAHATQRVTLHARQRMIPEIDLGLQLRYILECRKAAVD
jgi:hypothetical protein